MPVRNAPCAAFGCMCIICLQLPLKALVFIENESSGHHAKLAKLTCRVVTKVADTHSSVPRPSVVLEENRVCGCSARLPSPHTLVRPRPGQDQSCSESTEGLASPQRLADCNSTCQDCCGRRQPSKNVYKWCWTGTVVQMQAGQGGPEHSAR